MTSSGRPPAPEVASTRTSASPASAGRRTATITPVEVSLCAQASTSAPGCACGLGGVARVGLHDDRVLEERRAPAVTLANLCENSPKVRCSARLAHEPEGGGVPEGGRPAVAEGDLVALGQREELAQAGADAADDGLDGAWRCEVPMIAGALAGQVGELLGADLRRAAAEAPVGGLELRGDLERRGGGVHGRGSPRSGGDGTCPGVRRLHPSLPGGRFHLDNASRDGGGES